MMRYAVVRVSRRTGQAHTERVRSDMRMASADAADGNRLDPGNRYTVIPFEEVVKETRTP
jgi:hypothetical protein